MSILDTSTRRLYLYYRTARLPLSALGELALSCARLASFLRVFVSRSCACGGEQAKRAGAIDAFHPRRARKVCAWDHKRQEKAARKAAKQAAKQG